MRRVALVLLPLFCVVGCNQLNSKGAGSQSGNLSGSILDDLQPHGPGGMSLFPSLGDLQRLEANRPITDPSWNSSLLGTVVYDTRHDQRHGQSERDQFSINPEGNVSGDELMNLLRPGPATYEQFAHTLEIMHDTHDPHVEYARYLDNLVDQGLAALTLSKILDNESMKRKMPKDVSDARVDYIARAVVTRAAATMGKINFREEPVTRTDGSPLVAPNGQPVTRRVVGDHPSASYDQMYGWFREAISNLPADHRAFCLNMDWQYRDGGLGHALDELKNTQGGELQYPELTLEFRCNSTLPANCEHRKRNVAVTQGCLPGVQQEDLAHAIAEAAFYEDLLEPHNEQQANLLRQRVAEALDASKPSDLAQILARQDDREYRGVVSRALDRLASDLGRSFSAQTKAAVVQRAAADAVKADFDRFKQNLREMLRPIHRTVRRQSAWQRSLVDNVTDAQNILQYAVTTQEMRRLYDQNKNDVFYQLPMTATYHEFVLSGPKAIDFEQRFTALMIEQQRNLVHEINGPGAPTSEQDRQQRRDRVLEARRTVPLSILEQVKHEFAADIAAHRLTVETFSRSVGHVTGLVRPPSPHEDEETPTQPEQLTPAQTFERNFFDPAFAQIYYAIAVATGDAGKRHIGVLKNVEAGEKRILPMNDPLVDSTIRTAIQAKAETFIMREGAYALFRANRFQKRIDTCTDSKWPCLDYQSDRFATALFPESLYDGEQLTGVTANTHSTVFFGDGSRVDLGAEQPNTLGHRSELYKVKEISQQVVRRAFAAPNGTY